MNIAVILRRKSSGNIDFLSKIDIPILLKKIYVQRGINNINEIDYRINKLLKYDQLKGINKAVNLLIYAIKNKLKVSIIGDFDTDGATAIAVMIIALRQMGMNSVNFIVPNRFKDGYGLSANIIQEAFMQGTKMIITVDNGISSHAGIDLARKKDILVIITDHHLPENTLPHAHAIVNPNLANCKFKSKFLSGVGVAFYLMLALRAKLHQEGWFYLKKINKPKLSSLLDLVALGTIADMVPLDLNNRILVHQGINRIRNYLCRPGIQALIEISNRDMNQICTNDLGCVIGPKLNAAGRLDDMSIGVFLLLTENLEKARFIAKKLDLLNKNRKKIGQVMKNEALNICTKIKKNNISMPFILILYNDTWHQGIIGIIASYIKDIFYLPVIIFAPIGDDILKGSGRSIIGLHMFNAIKKFNSLYPNIIMSFGGHSMAIGLTIKKNKLSSFYQLFNKIIETDYAILKKSSNNIIWSDGELTEKEISLDTAKLLINASPWGQEFPDPLFDGKFYILNQYLLNNEHLRVKLKLISGGPILDGIIFNIHKQQLWLNNNTNLVKIAYKMGVNKFKGVYSLQLIIQNIWPL